MGVSHAKPEEKGDFPVRPSTTETRQEGKHPSSHDKQRRPNSTNPPGVGPGRVIDTNELMHTLEFRCRKMIEIIDNIRAEGNFNDDIRRYLNHIIKETGEELNNYNKTMMTLPGQYPSTESDAVDVKQIETYLKRVSIQRKTNAKGPRETKGLQSRLDAIAQENHILKTKIDQQAQQIRTLEKKHEEMVLRLSKVAGAQLTDNNPAIADLSDPDRPTKLGEDFKELYDNEWTDAYEQLVEEDGRSEDKAIKLLLETLQNVADFCQKKAGAFVKEIDKVIEQVFESEIPVDSGARRSMTMGAGKRSIDVSMHDMKLYDSWGRSNKTSEKSPDDLMRLTMQRRDKLTQTMETIRKDVALFLLPLVQKAYLSPLRWSPNCLPLMKPFIRKCLRISWLMVVQRPPMCFLGTDGPGHKKVKDVYTPYTRNGPVLDYVVWPAMLLREKGEMVAKGVAQFKQE